MGKESAMADCVNCLHPGHKEGKDAEASRKEKRKMRKKHQRCKMYKNELYQAVPLILNIFIYISINNKMSNLIDLILRFH